MGAAGRARRARGRLTVRVGAQDPADTNRSGSLPDVAVSARRAGATVSGKVANHSGIPQAGLTVYASAQRGGRFVAAGKVRLRNLAGKRDAPFTLKLAGRPGRASVKLEAPPTVLK